MRFLAFVLTLAAASWMPASFAAMYVCVDSSGAKSVQDHSCAPNEAQQKRATLHRVPVTGVVYASWARDVQMSNVNPESLQIASRNR